MKKKLLIPLFSLATLFLTSCGGGNETTSTGNQVVAQATIGNGVGSTSNSAEFNLSPNQAIFFDYSSKLSYGGVNSLTIGGTTLSTNLSMPYIGDKFSSEQIVGPFNSVGWDGELTSPLDLRFLVDATNKDTLLKLISAGVPDTAVSINFAVVSSCPVSALCSGYYTAFWTNGSTVSGNVVKSAAETYLKVETTPYTGISSPVLYEARLRISPPANLCGFLFLQSSGSNKWVGSWGAC